MKADRSTLIIRVPTRIHAALKSEAARNGISLNALCASLLEQPKRRLDSRLSAPLPAAQQGNAFEELVTSVASTFPAVTGVVLFGSMARGDDTNASDIDLAVILQPSVPIDRDMYDRWKEGNFPRKANPLFLHLPQSMEGVSGVWFEMALDGIVLLDTDFQVNRFLAKARRLIAAGAVIRKSTYGVSYWVHREQQPGQETS